MDSREYQEACLFAAIDGRLLEIWTAILDDSPLSEVAEEEVPRAMLAACLRTAYGRGYTDALDEVRRGRRGELARANGYITRGGA